MEGQFLITLTPCNVPSFSPFLGKVKTKSPSAQMRNKYGYMESPCLKPLVGAKAFYGSPFSSTLENFKDNQNIIADKSDPE